jgi:hypothetical protein
MPTYDRGLRGKLAKGAELMVLMLVVDLEDENQLVRCAVHWLTLLHVVDVVSVSRSPSPCSIRSTAPTVWHFR